MILVWTQTSNSAFEEVHPGTPNYRFQAFQNREEIPVFWEVTAVQSTKTWVTLRSIEGNIRTRRLFELPPHTSTEQLLQFVEFTYIFTPAEYLSSELMTE